MASEAVPDTSSLLSHVSNLETEKKKLMERMQLQEQQLERYTAEKRGEMKKQFDTVMMDYLKDIDVTDEKVREEFIAGLQTMVQKTKDESPVWKMIACASNTHKRNATELNRITTEYNALKQQVEGGTFRSPESRVGGKRSEPEPPTVHRGGNYWEDFEADIRGGGLSSFVPEPDRIQELRKDWKPLSAMQ